MFYLAVGLTIRKLREERGISARELGERADLKDYELSRIERGHQRLDLAGAVRVSKALDISLDAFVGMAQKIEPQVSDHKVAIDHSANARRKLKELVDSLET